MISWGDMNDSPAPDAIALRDLIRDIREMIEAREEYKGLPEARGGYA